MNQQEINNFTRMADSLEEEIFRLRAEIEIMKSKELDTMDHRMKDKIKMAQLEKDNTMLKLQVDMFEHREGYLLNKIGALEKELGITNEVSQYFAAYCNTGKELYHGK